MLLNISFIIVFYEAIMFTTSAKSYEIMYFYLCLIAFRLWRGCRRVYLAFFFMSAVLVYHLKEFLWMFFLKIGGIGNMRQTGDGKIYFNTF